MVFSSQTFNEIVNVGLLFIVLFRFFFQSTWLKAEFCSWARDGAYYRLYHDVRTVSEEDRT